MSTPFLGELKIFGFSFAPKGWALCNGQLLPINQNQALFALIGTYYGGNGQNNFALPNLESRIPLHQGNGFTIGQAGGQEANTVLISELPQHNHLVEGSHDDATVLSPTGNTLAVSSGAPYVPNANSGSFVALNPATVPAVGGSQPHENRQPLLTVNVCIALQGIFPSRN
jgi:microcystin-dependent protein